MMKNQKFKTNIKCGGCIATVKPYLDSLEDISWSVDTDKPEKILTVEGPATAEEIMNKVKEAGFEISPKKKVLGLF